MTSSAASANVGQSVTLTATVGVAAPGTGTPTGTVTFKDGTTTIGTGTLSVVSGKLIATLNTSSLTAGDHVITAVYAGDSTFTGSTSAKWTQQIV